MADLPELRVEFAVGATMGSIDSDINSLSWIDATTRVRLAEGLSFSRGRGAAGEPPTAGQLRLTLDNRDGAWNPGSTLVDPDAPTPDWGSDFGVEFGGATASTYGEFTVRTPVRVQARVDAGEWQPLWLGFVTDLDWRVDSGEVRVAVQAADTLSRAGRITTRPWMQSLTLIDTSVTDYWPLDDGTDTTDAANQIDGREPLRLRSDVLSPTNGLTASSAYATWQLPGPHTDDTALALTPYVDGADDDYISWRLKADIDQTSGTHVGLAAWVQPEPGRECHILAYDTDDGPSVALTVTVRDAGRKVRCTAYQGGTSSFITAPDTTITLDEPLTGDGWMHVAFNIDPAYRKSTSSEWASADYMNRMRVFINGQGNTYWSPDITPLYNSNLPTAGTEKSAGTLTVGGHRYLLAAPLSGRVAHVATRLPTAVESPPTDYLLDRGTGDDTYSRYIKLAYTTAQPAAMIKWISLSQGSAYPMSAQPTRRRYLLDTMQEVATVARGNIISTAEGALAFRPSRSRYQSAPALTLDARTDIRSAQGTFGVDDTAAVDEASVTLQPSGAGYTAQRDNSTGLESTSLVLWTDDGTHGESVAAGVANAPTATRSPRLMLSVHQAAHRGYVAALLDLELGDLIRVDDMPTAAPLATMQLTVEAIEHTIGPNEWTVALDTGPGELATAACVGSSAALSTVSPNLIIRP